MCGSTEELFAVADGANNVSFYVTVLGQACYTTL